MKLYLPILSYGGIEAGFLRSHQDLSNTLRKGGIAHTLPAPVDQESLITRGRNRVAHAFLKSDCTHLLFIDADIVFDPQVVVRLINSGHDFVGAPYPAKTVVNPRLIGNLLPDGAPDAEGKARVTVVDGFVKARDVGTGFVLLSRAVFDLIKPNVSKYKDDLIGGTDDIIGAYFDCGPEDSSREDSCYLSEDWWFSRLYQACGGTCWLDIDAKLGHIGKHMFTCPSYREQWAAEVRK